MKKYILCALLVFTGFSAVFSQSNIASFFITPVTGMGTSPEDNTFFYRQILFETEFQRYVIAKSQQTANYILQGTLIPGDSDPKNQSSREHIFNLSLVHNNTNEVIADQELIYQSLYDVVPFIPIIISNLLSNVPVIQAAQGMQDTQGTQTAQAAQAAQVAQTTQGAQGSQETQTAQAAQAAQAAQDTQNVQETQPPDRRYDRLYVGTEIIWMPKIYLDPAYFNKLNFGIGFSAEWQFLRFLSFGAGAVINLDWIYAEQNQVNTRPYIFLEIPITLRFNIRPSEKIMIEPFVGGHFNIPVSVKKSIETNLLSWIAGLQFGINAGHGILTFTPSFSMDIPTSERMLIYFGIGYKFGFLKR